MRRCDSYGFTLIHPRDPSASLGVTAFAVMLSGAPLGAKSKHLDSSEHSPLQYIPQCAASEGRTFECSPSPGMAADCRRKAPNRPTETLGKPGMTTFFCEKSHFIIAIRKICTIFESRSADRRAPSSRKILEDLRVTK